MGPANDKHQAPTNHLKVYIMAIIELNIKILIPGGRINHAHHLSQVVRALHDTFAFAFFQHKNVNIFLPISFNICFGCSEEPFH